MMRSSMSPPSLPDRQPMDHSDGSSNSSPDTCPESRSRSHSHSRQESRQPPPQPRKPIPRKGHTKSRRGCYNCKRRRIKCNEGHPECNHCIKAGLRCEYPANIIQTTQRAQSSPSPQEMVNLRSMPGMFVSDLSRCPALPRQHLTRIIDDGGHAPFPSFLDHSLSSFAGRRRQDMDHRDTKLRT